MSERQHSKATLLEACAVAGLKPPVSEKDLAEVFRRLADLGIHHNLEGSAVWRRYVGATAEQE